MVLSDRHLSPKKKKKKIKIAGSGDTHITSSHPTQTAGADRSMLVQPYNGILCNLKQSG